MSFVAIPAGPMFGLNCVAICALFRSDLFYLSKRIQLQIERRTRGGRGVIDWVLPFIE
jgi:hypothetical protein